MMTRANSTNDEEENKESLRKNARLKKEAEALRKNLLRRKKKPKPPQP